MSSNSCDVVYIACQTVSSNSCDVVYIACQTVSSNSCDVVYIACQTVSSNSCDVVYIACQTVSSNSCDVVYIACLSGMSCLSAGERSAGEWQLHNLSLQSSHICICTLQQQFYFCRWRQHCMQFSSAKINFAAKKSFKQRQNQLSSDKINYPWLWQPLQIHRSSKKTTTKKTACGVIALSLPVYSSKNSLWRHRAKTACGVI